MNCEQTTERVTERLSGLLDAADERDLVKHLGGCPACRDEAAEIERLWAGLGQLDDEVPSARMRVRFYSALSAYREQSARAPMRLLERLWPLPPVWQVAGAAAVLLLGLFIGLQAGADSSNQQEIQALRDDLRTISLALLEHQSASERLLGVEWSRRGTPDPRVVDALLTAVRRDPSVNVRLAAVDALAGSLESPRIGQELLASLDGQDSPVVLVTMARLLTAAGVKGSEAAVQRVLDRPGLDPLVQEPLREAMQL